jgi:cation diffusion facilitator family transporter
LRCREERGLRLEKKGMTTGQEEIARDLVQAEKKAAAMSTVLAALLITVTKATVGILTGSLGILAEAADSALDVVAAILTFAAVRMSGKPADERHLYGHGKVENMAALVETLLLLFTCGWIIYEGISRLFFRSVEIDANIWAFGVVAAAMLIDLNRMRALQRAADKHDSQALQASALRFRTDIWTSSVVLLGLTLVRLQKWLGAPEILLKADSVAGLGVAMVVLFLGIQLGKSAMDVLLDTAPEGLAERIRDQVRRIDGVDGCRQVRVRRAGAQSFVDIVIGVNGDRSFDSAHEVTADVERAVGDLVPRADVVVHYEPSQESSDIASLVRRTAQRMGARAHDIWVRRTDGVVHVEFHLEVERDASLEQAHDLATQIECEVKEAAPAVADIVAHLEPVGDAASVGTRVKPEDRARFEAEIVSVVNGFVGEGACHHVELWKEEDGFAASLHCSLTAELSVQEAHDLSERLEEHLRKQMPLFRRVVIHLEPVP